MLFLLFQIFFCKFMHCSPKVHRNCFCKTFWSTFLVLLFVRALTNCKGLLTNSEGWVNIVNQDLESLEKPDSILQRKIFSVSRSPCKAFMMLELGIIPVRLVIMKNECNSYNTFYKRGQIQCYQGCFKL